MDKKEAAITAAISIGASAFGAWLIDGARHVTCPECKSKNRKNRTHVYVCVNCNCRFTK